MPPESPLKSQPLYLLEVLLLFRYGRNRCFVAFYTLHQTDSGTKNNINRNNTGSQKCSEVLPSSNISSSDPSSPSTIPQHQKANHGIPPQNKSPRHNDGASFIGAPNSLPRRSWIYTSVLLWYSRSITSRTNCRNGTDFPSPPAARGLESPSMQSCNNNSWPHKLPAIPSLTKLPDSDR